MKIRYVPVTTVPIFFYMKSCTEMYAQHNGFKFYRVAGSFKPIYFIQRGKHLWREQLV